MAFQTYIDFYKLIKEIQQSELDDERAITENFILEERLSADREKGYAIYAKPVNDFPSWKKIHNNIYFEERIKQQNPPETFTEINNKNSVSGIDENQFLIRLDRIFPEACRDIGLSPEEMKNFLKGFIADPEKSRDIVSRYFEQWNMHRDFRPVFAGFWGEVKNIFEDEKGNEIHDPDWANKLRDLLGLSHYEPETHVILQRYPVSEVLGHKGGQRSMATPTVLDTDFNPVFFPAPLGYRSGLTCTCLDDSTNQFNLIPEILHEKINFKPEWIYRIGEISRPLGKNWSDARRMHYECLQKELKHANEL